MARAFVPTLSFREGDMVHATYLHAINGQTTEHPFSGEVWKAGNGGLYVGNVRLDAPHNADGMASYIRIDSVAHRRLVLPTATNALVWAVETVNGGSYPLARRNGTGKWSLYDREGRLGAEIDDDQFARARNQDGVWL